MLLISIVTVKAFYRKPENRNWKRFTRFVHFCVLLSSFPIFLYTQSQSLLASVYTSEFRTRRKVCFAPSAGEWLILIDRPCGIADRLVGGLELVFTTVIIRFSPCGPTPPPSSQSGRLIYSEEIERSDYRSRHQPSLFSHTYTD